MGKGEEGGGGGGGSGGWGVASAPQTAPSGKLRLAHKHDLTVSLFLFSHFPTLNLSPLIAVISSVVFSALVLLLPFSLSSLLSHPQSSLFIYQYT